MHELEHRIFVDDYCLDNEYALTYGDKKDELVYFKYENTKRYAPDWYWDRKMPYHEALELARRRARDGRYKNYEFHIFRE